MATNTKLLQAMADAMLPLFGDMPSVPVVVKDHESFCQEPCPLAVYDAPSIVVNPSHPPTSSFNDLKATICHELIHAWLYRKNLHQAGEFLDTHHNEWFVRKALEINRMNIDGLTVSVDFLLTNPEALEIYNRIAKTSRLVRRTSRLFPPRVETARLKNDSLQLVLMVFFLLMLISLFFNITKAGYVWSACAVAVLLWMGVEAVREIGSSRSSVKKALRKAARLEVVAPAEEVRPRKE